MTANQVEVLKTKELAALFCVHMQQQTAHKWNAAKCKKLLRIVSIVGFFFAGSHQVVPLLPQSDKRRLLPVKKNTMHEIDQDILCASGQLRVSPFCSTKL